MSPGRQSRGAALLTVAVVAVVAAATVVPAGALSAPGPTADTPAGSTTAGGGDGTDSGGPGVAGVAGARSGESAGSAGEESPSLDSHNGTPPRLSAGEGASVSGFATPDPELSDAVAIGHREFAAVFQNYRTRSSFGDSETANRAAVEQTLDRIRRRLGQLRDREARAVRAYHAGSIGREELVRRVARVGVEAAALARSLTRLRREAAGVIANTQLDIRLGNLQRDLRSLVAPVRLRAAEAIRGRSVALPVAVVATAEGLTLSAVADREYLRETVRLDHYAPNGSGDPLGLDAALARIYEVYPGFEELDGPDESLRADPAGDGLWRFVVTHTYGTTTVHLGRTTGEVYREVHRLRLARLPTTEVVDRTSEGLRVVVNRTDAGTPVGIRVTDANADGRPVDATVSVGNRTVGATGEDGTLWTVGESGPFVLTVDAGDRTTTVTVETVDRRGVVPAVSSPSSRGID